MTHEEWVKYFYGHWNFPEKSKMDDGNVPRRTPRRLIKMYSLWETRYLTIFKRNYYQGCRFA